MRIDPLQRYYELFQPSADGRAVDFRGYNVGHTVSRLTVPWNMQRFFLANALLKQNKQDTSADQTLSGEFAPSLSLDFKFLIIFMKSAKDASF
jgi:hypothetical protein